MRRFTSSRFYILEAFGQYPGSFRKEAGLALTQLTVNRAPSGAAISDMVSLLGLQDLVWVPKLALGVMQPAGAKPAQILP